MATCIIPAVSPYPGTRPSGVCLLSGEFPPDRGGVGDYTARLAGALAARGLPVVVLTRRRADAPARRHYDDAATGARVPVYAAVPGWDARALGTVVAALRCLGPHPILHVQFQAGAFDLGGTVHLLPAWLRIALPGARVVTTFHDFLVPYLFPKAGPLRPAANRLLARTSHRAIFADPADLTLAGVGVRGRVVPIGSNLDVRPVADTERGAIRNRLGAEPTTFLVGYFGFLNRSKGVPTLLRAVRRLVEAGRPVRLALIGAETGASDPTDLAEARAVAQLVESLELRERVTPTGYLEPAALSAALLACDVLALPFLDGASSRRGTLMGAIAHGVPIVTTRSPGAGDAELLPHTGNDLLRDGENAMPRESESTLLRDGTSALLVPPGDHEALVVALTRLADDPALRARLAAGAAMLAPRIGWGAIAEAVEATYAAILDPESP